MRVLLVASYNKNRFAPFIAEQAESLQKAGCEIAWFGVQGKGLAGYLKAIPKLRAKISEFKPDIILAHYGLSCLLANVATRRVPVVSTYHGSDIHLKSVRRLSRLAIWLSAWNIFVSKQNMAMVGAVEGKKCSLIPCGVELSQDQMQTREEARRALGWSSEDKKVLFAGAFDNDVKNPKLAQEAIALLNGVELMELKGYTRQQVNTLLCAADVLLMTSNTEGSPQVIKEAMACGCPIVSVDVGDVKERTERVDGCYVVPSREPKEIALALEKALAFEGKTNGRDKIMAHGLTNDQVAKKIIEIYESISQ